jgi:hypothetical protein
MNDEELTGLIKEMVAYWASIASSAAAIESNVESIANTLHRVESGEEWEPTAREYEVKD